MSYYKRPYHLERYEDGWWVVVDSQGHHHNAYPTEDEAREKMVELNEETGVSPA